MPALGRKMGNIDRGDGVVGGDPQRRARGHAPERRLHFEDGQGAAKPAGVDFDKGR